MYKFLTNLNYILFYFIIFYITTKYKTIIFVGILFFNIFRERKVQDACLGKYVGTNCPKTHLSLFFSNVGFMTLTQK